MDDSAEWLMKKIGPPKPPTLYNIEYVLKNGGYTNYSVKTHRLSELINQVLRENSGIIGRMAITPYNSTINHPKLQLINYWI